MANFIQFPGPTVVELLSKLQSETPAQWGIMTAQHMLEHLMLPLAFSRGEFKVPLVTPIEKVEKVKRIMLLSDAPLKRDFAAPFLGDGLQALKHANFEEAKLALMAEIELYINFWEQENEASFTHPIFGNLNKEEWYLFHRKHFTHHFTQFGLL
jgi:oxepin-CoA hydrolase/3-oxo-5,6-dehydrosuberyl-CoA semialdehyde dehydrogenase